MKLIYVTLVLLVYVVIEVQSERTRVGVCKGCPREDYIRIKRGRYYSSSPIKFYNRPPMSHPVKGAFSFTPPPGLLMDDGRHPQNMRPKVSTNRNTNEGLGDEDINHIMKYLSQQDLDKIVDFANEKERLSPTYSKESLYKKPVNTGSKAGNSEGKVINSGNVPQLDNDMHDHEYSRPYSIEYNNPYINDLKDTNQFTIPDLEPTALFMNNNKVTLNRQLDSERVTNSQKFSNLNAYALQEANKKGNSANVLTYSSLMQEVNLPKPSHLREDDFEISYTNNVPTVVQANSNSYKIENLGTLPLMNYHSKLDTVDSYKVPHYTVTSPEKYQAPASSAKIPVEPAPPASTAREQSESHLKATKIWTHKSKGTAYTLHDDGTLSLEKASRPKMYYGFS